MGNAGRAGKTQRKAAQAADGKQRKALRLHGIAAQADRVGIDRFDAAPRCDLPHDDVVFPAAAGNDDPFHPSGQKLQPGSNA